MDIKLNARLSAYNKIPTPIPECGAEEVTKQDIDSLFDPSIQPALTPLDELRRASNDVTFKDIDSLFTKR